ncbi:hypothetical protein PRIC2_009598 [Phytophthora ramorum]
MAPIPCHPDVLYLIAQYLQARGLFASSLALQQESGLDVTWLRGSSRELTLLRRWIFDGDVDRARALLRPLQNDSVGPEEMEAALLALDELQVLVMKTLGGGSTQERARLAKAKLKCFEKLVPLFRAPVDEMETDIFKYVAMPKLQLVGLIHDAVLFHRQNGDNTGDCISVVCDVNEVQAADGEEEGGELLLLEMPRDGESVGGCGLDVEGTDSVARSVDWTSSRSRRRNPMALSVSLRRRQWGEDEGDADTDEWTEEVEERLKEGDERSGTPDVKETVDVAVSCGLEEWSDVATQTEGFSLQCLDEKADEGVAELEVGHGDEGNERDDLESSNCPELDAVVVEPAESGDSEPAQHDQEVQMDQEQLRSSNDSNKSFVASWSRKSAQNITTSTFDVLEAHPEVDQSEVRIEDAAALPDEDNSNELQQELGDGVEFGNEIPLQKGPPQRYDELTLEHVVCASVIAEVKEPQAVRALDAHPNGTHLAVGTNARALRIFDLATPLQQRQQQQTWASPLILLLPLLPVALERHKHHDSGIYCVSYNRYLPDGVGAATMLASGAADGSVKVLTTRERDPFQLQQADELWIQRGDTSGSLGKTRALEFASPHLLWVASTSDRRLRCWDIRRAQRSSSLGPFQTFDGHVGEIQAIAMPQPSTSGSVNTLLLSAALDKTVRLWDTRSRRCERLVTCGAHAAFSLHFQPSDEKLVVSGHQDGSVALWDLRSTAREALQIVVPHEDECRSVRWSPGGRWLLSAAFDGTLCVMQASNSTLQPVASYHKHYGKVLQAQWHPTEPAFVSSGADKRVKLWAFA